VVRFGCSFGRFKVAERFLDFELCVFRGSRRSAGFRRGEEKSRLICRVDFRYDDDAA
jgi:hypothetical protein